MNAATLRAPAALVECVPNVSEGRDRSVLAALATVIRDVRGLTLADVHADPDHHRAVLTCLGAPEAVEAGARALAARVVALVDMRRHRGLHPRIGALDVLPFVPLAGVSMAEVVALARRAGRAIAETHALPVWFYGAAATRPDRATPRLLRRGGYEGLAARLAAPDGAPDEGPARFDPRAGAVLVGAREVLVAFNVWLASADVEIARDIARAVRESSGGLPGVQAMGVFLDSRGVAQVSMNLLDYRRTPVPAVFDRVVAEARRRGVAVTRSELVGLVPRGALAGRSPDSVGLGDLSPERVLDTYLEPGEPLTR